MGNDFQTASTIKHESHTDGEEQPLNTEMTPSIRFPPVDGEIVMIPGAIPASWERRTDLKTRKIYYVDHNTQTAHWNPPDALTKINPFKNVKPNTTHFSQVIIHNESNKTNQLSDCWDIVNPNRNEYISFDNVFDNTIYLRSRVQRTKQWISCFGTKIVTKGEYKRWRIKILSNDPKGKRYIHKPSAITAKVMIGVVDIDTLSDTERGNAIQGEYWRLPHFGYGFNGENGKKYHISKHGASYSNKYKVGDTVTVELNRTQNRFIAHNDLRFYTNDKVDGMAFNVDNDRNYVIAVAMCSDKYRIQISDE